MKKKARAVMLALLALTMLISCGRGGERDTNNRYFAYLETPHSLALTGKLDGMSFATTLSYEKREASGTSPSAPPSFTLTYLSPAALSGVGVQYDALTGQLLLSRDGLRLATEQTGLADVAFALLCEDAVSSSHREQDGLVVRTLGGTSLTLDGETGMPRALSVTRKGRAIELSVTNWE